MVNPPAPRIQEPRYPQLTPAAEPDQEQRRKEKKNKPEKNPEKTARRRQEETEDARTRGQVGGDLRQMSRERQNLFDEVKDMMRRDKRDRA